MSVANPINAPAGALNPGCWKRKGSEEDEDKIESNVKKARYSWYVTLESESPQPTSSDEDDESIHSVQEQETEYVQDTSDTSTNAWFSSSDNGDVVRVEYEVASSSDDENPFIDGLSSSDPEDIITVGMIAAAIYDSDVGLADDSDDSRSSRDSEISHADYWTCVQCNTSNNNPLFRYCDKCYQTRKNFLPPRPKGRKRRRKLSKSKAGQVQSLEGHELTALDSGLGSSQGSQRSLSFELKRIETERISNLTRRGEPRTSLSFSQESTDTVDNGGTSGCSQPTSISLSRSSELSFVSQPGTSSMSQSSEMNLSQPSTSLMSQPSSQEEYALTSKNDENRIEKTIDNSELNNCSQESMRSSATTLSIDSRDSNHSDCSQDNLTISKLRKPLKKSQLPIDPGSSLCLTCTVAPKDGIFVHGQTSHICCCYRCAKTIWKTTKHCPLCNRRVTNVLKAYYG